MVKELLASEKARFEGFKELDFAKLSRKLLVDTFVALSLVLFLYGRVDFVFKGFFGFLMKILP